MMKGHDVTDHTQTKPFTVLRISPLLIIILKKIVHLVRDPRFQTQSRLLRPQSFLCESWKITGYCQAYAGKAFKQAFILTENEN